MILKHYPRMFFPLVLILSIVSVFSVLYGLSIIHFHVSLILVVLLVVFLITTISNLLMVKWVTKKYESASDKREFYMVTGKNLKATIFSMIAILPLGFLFWMLGDKTFAVVFAISFIYGLFHIVYYLVRQNKKG